MSNKRFYDDGILFECTRCGNCCKVHGQHAYLYLVSQNIDEISRYLKMSPVSFVSSYCASNHSIDQSNTLHLTMDNGQCNFLDSNRCGIYPVRPAQCRSWPFLTEHLHPETWQLVIAICPGIGTGKRYTKDEIESLAMARDLEQRSV